MKLGGADLPASATDMKKVILVALATVMTYLTGCGHVFNYVLIAGYDDSFKIPQSSPLTDAVEAGDYERVESLLKGDFFSDPVNPNRHIKLPRKEGEAFDAGYTSPLGIAAQNRDLKMIALLKRYKGRPDSALYIREVDEMDIDYHQIADALSWSILHNDWPVFHALLHDYPYRPNRSKYIQLAVEARYLKCGHDRECRKTSNRIIQYLSSNLNTSHVGCGYIEETLPRVQPDDAEVFDFLSDCNSTPAWKIRKDLVEPVTPIIQGKTEY